MVFTNILPVHDCKYWCNVIIIKRITSTLRGVSSFEYLLLQRYSALFLGIIKELQAARAEARLVISGFRI